MDSREMSKLLADGIERRFAERRAKRSENKATIEREGILKAAGVAAAVGRAAHMLPQEGSGLMRRRAGESQEANFEAILGIDDSDPVNFLGRGQVAARAVCRLVAGRKAGTGFLVAPGVLLTNNHVIASAEEARGTTAEFDYELDLDDQPRSPIQRFTLEPDRLFVTSSAENGLDFTLVAVAPQNRAGAELGGFGYIPLDPRIDKILIGEPAIIIQHPRGEQKRVCLFSAELVDKLEDYLHYVTDTDHGSSGSCVVNRSFQLVALHHASVPSGEQRRGHSTVVNEGIRVSSILAALETGRRVEGDYDAALDLLTRPDVVRDGRPQLGRSADRASPQHRGQRDPDSLETSLAAQPDDHFAERASKHHGYKPNFLRVAVPLPRVASALEDDVAVTADGESELKYTHYSVVHSISRRMPWVTAVNIDGGQSRQLARTDRDFEAADRWFLDPRLDAELQLTPDLFDRTDFDFGHLVRREDPVWGDSNTARMANDDTFYITNATPQHHDLNTKTWLRLENAVLEGAREGKLKVSVFTGPVLAPNDPVVLGVQVPTAFWKVVAWVERGELRSAGFMQSQSKLVSRLKVRPEAFDQLERVEEFQVPIRDIARATSLSFGPLLRADISGGRRRPIDEAVFRALPGDSTSSEDARPDRQGAANGYARSNGSSNGTRNGSGNGDTKPRTTTPADSLRRPQSDAADEVTRLTGLLREVYGVLSRYFTASRRDGTEPAQPRDSSLS
jgi:endonuclease G